ncbi:hypothetical protein C8R46DRAFT_1289221 [Mycena filopes]|nr:hypothetical protein C8R46DRAFT_1289221 [Mycena filopes]
MPEKGVICLYEREIRWEERQMSSKIDKTQETSFYGHFVTHPDCCARPNGTRQTFIPHPCGAGDLFFTPIPSAPLSESGHCPSCNSMVLDDGEEEDPVPTEHTDVGISSKTATSSTKFNANAVNSLDISGRIYAKARGKELIVAICNSSTGRNFLLRVNFGLEAHCFWMPTEWYHRIVAQAPVQRGAKSFAYPIPAEYMDGPSRERLISLQAAFVRPKWTLVFVDHNVMLQFHLMQASSSFVASDLEPGSKIWPYLWSRTHGPVHHLEPEATLDCLASWRSEILEAQDFTPIFQAIKTTQTVFNGSGAQEATDLLLLAFVHPQMPAYYICNDLATWTRFHATVLDYDTERATLSKPKAALPTALSKPKNPLPYISGPRPLRFDGDRHRKYLNKIYSYRRSEVVIFAQHDIDIAHDLGLFFDGASLGPDGRAQASSSFIASVPTKLRYEHIDLPNFALTWYKGKTKYVTYSPFTARPGSDWCKAVRETAGSDVREEFNKTTLDLYSFRVFVDCVWSTKTVSAAEMPKGRRALKSAGNGTRKRPRASDILKTGGTKKKRRIVEEEKENVELNGIPGAKLDPVTL